MNKDSEQSQRFIETARELGCDESPQAFNDAMKKLLTVKPDEIQNEKTKNDKN